MSSLSTTISPGHTPWSAYPVVFDQPVTTETIGKFANNGIEIKKYYWPGIFRGYTGNRSMYAVDITHSLYIQDRCACFPIYSSGMIDTQNLLKERLIMSLDI